MANNTIPHPLATPKVGWDQAVNPLPTIGVLLVGEDDGSALRPESFAGDLLDLKHGPRTRFFPAGLGVAALGAPTYTFDQVSFTGVEAWEIPLTFSKGDRLITAVFKFTGATTGSKNFKIERAVDSTGVVTAVASGDSILAVTRNDHEIADFNHTVLPNNSYRALMTAAASGDKLIGVEITWDRP